MDPRRSPSAAWQPAPIPEIASGQPGQALTRIWLGDKPVQADLKKAPLGG